MLDLALLRQSITGCLLIDFEGQNALWRDDRVSRMGLGRDLPKLNGIGLCQRLGDRGMATPMLMLTARDTSTDNVPDLEAGADAYMVKPFRLAELLAQVRALPLAALGLNLGMPGVRK
ncbi:response regulator [Nodosilinea sp. LEGE 07088]|nr:response regulator [Nodosilinea sp. LEGE 07088]MBE9138889.1 response regulator [Nodosilinea sp. LEGE 07088]